MLLAPGRLVVRALDLAGLDDEEVVALLALRDDLVALGERHRLERVRDLLERRRVQALHEGHLLQKGEAPLGRALLRADHEAVERLDVDGPEHAGRRRADRRRALRAVQQRQLPEGVARGVLADLLRPHEDLRRAREEHVERVALVALLDDDVARRPLVLLHAVDDLQDVRRRQGAKHVVVLEGVDQQRLLLLRLRRRRERLVVLLRRLERRRVVRDHRALLLLEERRHGRACARARAFAPRSSREPPPRSPGARREQAASRDG
mmetsp:Transcript_5144/g.17494  ORF Transcript_5144/g.17494 Transcript_5144/m.17494 type:complete len:264 (-) Transcript_5144:194-985(-)